MKIAKVRSGFQVKDILLSLAIALSTFYRVRKRREVLLGNGFILRQSRRNIYELLPQERMLIIDYALTYPNPRIKNWPKRRFWKELSMFLHPVSTGY